MLRLDPWNQIVVLFAKGWALVKALKNFKFDGLAWNQQDICVFALPCLTLDIVCVLHLHKRSIVEVRHPMANIAFDAIVWLPALKLVAP